MYFAVSIPVVGAGQETCYYRVKASKTGLFGKQVFVCVQVLIELVEDQFFKDSRKHRENRYRPVVRFRGISLEINIDLIYFIPHLFVCIK